MIDSKKSWVICLVSSLFFMDEFMRINIFNNLQQDLTRDLLISTSQYSQLSACYFYGNVLMLFPAGIMLDRISVKKILLCVTIACAFASLAMAYSNSFIVAVISRLVIGFCGAFPLLAVFKLATRWFSSNKLAFVIGVVVTIAMIGGLIAQTPFLILKNMIGWRNVMLVDAAFGFISALVMFKFVEDFPEKFVKPVHDAFSLSKFLSVVREAGSNAHTWIAGFSISLLNLPIFIFGAIWGLPYLMQYHALSDVDSSIVVSMMFIGMIVGSPLMGAWSDNYMFKFERGLKIIHQKNRSQVLFISGLALVAISILLILHGPWNFDTLLIFFFFIGLFSSGQVVGYPYISENNKPELAATAGGISSTLIMAGGVVQPIFGWLLESTKDYQYINHVALYSAFDYKLALSIIPVSCLIVMILTLKMKS